MKTSAQIKMNYREAMQQARDLDTLAGKIRTTANQKVEQSMQLLATIG